MPRSKRIKNIYDHNSIRILDYTEIHERFYFTKINSLAEKYGKDVKWLKRLFEACILAGVDEQWAVDKYLKKQDLPRNLEVETILKDICTDAFRKR